MEHIKSIPCLFAASSCMLILYAGNTSLAADKKDCHEAAITQADMNLCAIADGHKADAELEGVYNKLIAKVSPEGKIRLRSARNAWIAYRALQCDFNSYGTLTGSVHPMIISDCYADLTNEYRKLLEQQLNCEEGDLSCVRQ